MVRFFPSDYCFYTFHTYPQRQAALYSYVFQVFWSQMPTVSYNKISRYSTTAWLSQMRCYTFGAHRGVLGKCSSSWPDTQQSLTYPQLCIVRWFLFCSNEIESVKPVLLDQVGTHLDEKRCFQLFALAACESIFPYSSSVELKFTNFLQISTS